MHVRRGGTPTPLRKFAFLKKKLPIEFELEKNQQFINAIIHKIIIIEYNWVKADLAEIF